MPLYQIGQTRVLFIHIPKTAGTALDAHLAALGPAIFNTSIIANRSRRRNVNLRHLHGDLLRQVFFPQMIDHAFTVVRHPVARAISEYRYQRRAAGLHLTRWRMAGFNSWLHYSLRHTEANPDYRDRHFRPQVDFLCFDCAVHRYEDGLEAVMAGVSAAAGLDIPFLPAPRNISPHRPVHVSQSSLDLIAKVYAADFDRFGYRVEVPSLKGVTGPS